MTEVDQREVPTRPSALDAAKAFIEGLLAAGPQPAADLLHAAAEVGHAEHTVRRAAKVLGVKAVKSRGPRSK